MSTATLTTPTPQNATPAAAAPADNSAAVMAAVKKVSTIATLPEVTAQIIKTVEDPKSSACQLHKIVSHDPALVTRILKVVNSAFYGLPGQIGSIERAIVLLGINAINNIAVAASLGQNFRGPKLCDGFADKDLSTHCIAVGVTAREMAKQMKVPVADEAFIAGMIHDVGILVSLQIQPEQLRTACERARDFEAEGQARYQHELHGQRAQLLADLLQRAGQQAAGHDPGSETIASAPSAGVPVSDNDLVAKLERLSALYRAGSLNYDEFERAKQATIAEAARP
jgi:hypothetical protein